jgi:hypothetical protein
VYDISGILFSSFPVLEVTALLVRGDAMADVRHDFPPGFDLTPALRGLSATR